MRVCGPLGNVYTVQDKSTTRKRTHTQIRQAKNGIIYTSYVCRWDSIVRFIWMYDKYGQIKKNRMSHDLIAHFDPISSLLFLSFSSTLIQTHINVLTLILLYINTLQTFTKYVVLKLQKACLSNNRTYVGKQRRGKRKSGKNPSKKTETHQFYSPCEIFSNTLALLLYYQHIPLSMIQWKCVTAVFGAAAAVVVADGARPRTKEIFMC